MFKGSMFSPVTVKYIIKVVIYCLVLTKKSLNALVQCTKLLGQGIEEFNE